MREPSRFHGNDMSLICICSFVVGFHVTPFYENRNYHILKTCALIMTTITNATELRNKVNLEKEMAVKYGVQQNLLIALKNLNNNPPYTDFDIGLPPYNHQSDLWSYELEKSVLYELAKEMEMDFIDNHEIEDHVFKRMYEPETVIKILGETIFLLHQSGFGITFDYMFGVSIQDLLQKEEFNDLAWEEELQRLFDSPTLENFFEDFFRLFADITKSVDRIISEPRHFERAPDISSLGFIPNIGLTIRF